MATNNPTSQLARLTAAAQQFGYQISELEGGVRRAMKELETGEWQGFSYKLDPNGYRICTQLFVASSERALLSRLTEAEQQLVV